MLIIQHRINKLCDLNKIDESYGIEIDVRYHENELVLAHDPLNHHINKPEKLVNILKNWKNKGPLILNVKTEGIEDLCIDLMDEFKVKTWFFLDMSMPYFVKYSKLSKAKLKPSFSKLNLAVRYSEFEPIEYALSFADSVKWVWVDSFSGKAVSSSKLMQLKENGFNVCIVSPELQGFSLEAAEEYRREVDLSLVDAVCTKKPSLWG